MPHILVVEDNKDINKLITDALQNKHYTVSSCFNAIQGLNVFNNNTIDMVITDLMLPIMSGEELIQEIRKHSQVHIIVISAKTDNSSKLEGLRIGADDYLFKPFLEEELLIKLQNYFKKKHPSKISINQGEVLFELGKPELYINGSIISLTSVEYKILQVFVESNGSVITRDHMLQAVYDMNDEVFDRVVDVHIRNIRKKISDIYETPLIKTVYGMGYQFVGVKDET